MARLQVRLIGDRDVIDRLQTINTEAATKARKVTQDSARRIIKEARRRAPVDTGMLRDSIDAVITEHGLNIQVVVGAKYGIFVELGTRPHFPPPRALRGWAERHGMAGKEFAIARRIAQRGTRKQPFLFPAWNKERPVYLAKMTAALRELGV